MLQSHKVEETNRLKSFSLYSNAVNTGHRGTRRLQTTPATWVCVHRHVCMQSTRADVADGTRANFALLSQSLGHSRVVGGEHGHCGATKSWAAAGDALGCVMNNDSERSWGKGWGRRSWAETGEKQGRWRREKGAAAKTRGGKWSISEWNSKTCFPAERTLLMTMRHRPHGYRGLERKNYSNYKNTL